MDKGNKIVKNITKAAGIWCLFFCAALLVEYYFRADATVPALMVLSVFVISYLTDGFFYGILASMLSVMALNFAFTFPYFAFNFSIPENIISAVIMLIITIMTCTLTTQLKNQEKIRVESAKEKMRGNLLRAVSHDLRTPLTTICGASSAIVENYDQLNKKQVLQLANGIREDSQWLVRMVENILSITRIDGEGVKITKTATVREELIDSVLMKFRKRYPDQKIEIDIPDEFISIPMDAVLIEQVLMNILENAMQHAKGLTVIGLSVFVPGDKAVFEISDDGCGIEKERLKGIFTDYFEMKDAPVDNQKKSMGIGLAVCASIIRAHNGVITAANRESGGCIFRFTLDLEESKDEQLSNTSDRG